MRLRILIISFLVVLSAFSRDAVAKIPVAEKGILDLRNLDRDEDFIVNLNGEWEFYWKKMLHPHDFEKASVRPDGYGQVPSYWTDYSNLSVRPEKTGYATYRLTVLLPHRMKNSLGIDMPVFDSSYDLYINGDYYGGNGIPGKTAEETVSEYKKNFFRLKTVSDTLSIIVIVANYDHRRGGFWLPAKFGTFAKVQSKLAGYWAWQWSIISMLLGFSLFFLFFYLISHREKEILYFSIATICLAIRPLVTSHYLILDIIFIPWEWLIRIEYLGLFIMIIAWAWYLRYIYPSLFIKVTGRILTIVFTLIALLTLFIPVRVFSYSTLIYYPLMFVLMGYPLYMSLKGAFRKNVFDILYFAAFVLLFASGIHDIQVASGKNQSSTGYILSYFILLFVFIQAGLLMYKWIKSFNEKEKLKNELEFMNRNLERLVIERTQEIIARNQEIETQNRMIALQNSKLSETVQLKNRIFSVIAHDLRSPVVNILYMLSNTRIEAEE